MKTFWKVSKVLEFVIGLEKEQNALKSAWKFVKMLEKVTCQGFASFKHDWIASLFWILEKGNAYFFIILFYL